MAKRKERTLEELYNVTKMIMEPEITPVLRGSWHMQGPVDETDYDIQTDTVSSRVGKGFGRYSMSQKVQLRAESGTCNVCSAPCSSCMHFNRARMGSKTDESSGETCRGNAASQYSINEGDVLPPLTSRACDNLQHTASETSNLLSVTSSHDSLSENAESKANLRSYDTFDASEVVEMCPKLSSGGTVAEDQLPSKPQCASNQGIVSNKYEDAKSVEGHDDNISCVSGANDGNIVVDYDNRNIDRKKLLCSSASASSLGPVGFGKRIHNHTASGSSDIHHDVEENHSNSRRQIRYTDDSLQKVPPISLSTAPNTDAGSSSPKVQSPYSHSEKSPTFNSNVRDLEEDLSFHRKGKLPESSIELMNSSLTKEVAADSLYVKKSVSKECANIFQDIKSGLIGGDSDVSIKLYPKLEAETDGDSGDLPDETLKCSDQNEQDKLNQSVELPDMQEPPLPSPSGDESDESDIVEHDVKVCDICGDAGREDLLAICSRCSDGAEHTYCMREMLDKVPEGQWLCEECKFAEETEKQKQDKVEVVDGNVKNQCFGLTSTVDSDLFVKLDTKDSDVEGNRSNKVSPSTQASRKRHADNIEVASVAKRQALETITGSPKASSPSRTAALSRDCSFRNLDKGKAKPTQQTSFGSHYINDIPETARPPTTGSCPQAPRGTLSKSNSFSAVNSKPKVKLVDDVAPHKQKWAREPASLDTKEGPIRMMGKSMSFKSAYSGRSSTTESKVKMLSSKFSHVHDAKGLKKVKERNTSERKNLSKSDRTLVCSVTASSTVSTPKIDQKLTPRGENVSLFSVSNNRDSKAVQSDGKLTTTSKPTGHLACKGSEVPFMLGEGKRQSSCSPNAIGPSPTNGLCSSVEQKPYQVSPKDEPSSSSSRTTERPSSNANGILQDGLPRSRESTVQAERTGESSLSRSRQGVSTGGINIPCQKCKEMGHDAQFCTIGSPRASAIDPSAARSSREEITKGNKLKAAIQAAMLKKPGIYKKNRLPDQSDELSMSSTDLNCEITSQDQLSVSSSLRNTISAEGTYEGQTIFRSCSSDSCKQTHINDVKQLTVDSTEAFKAGELDYLIPSDGKPTLRDFPSHVSATTYDLSRMSTIPELEYIWQGDFEVHRSGKVLDLCSGIQAHLSNCSSPKVLEVVKKFPHKVPLTEVPRLSTWPTQFHESGAAEDNIALYFFAKDLESYGRNYKILLESMMKNDLALKGNLDGVELLIFPSNQLPEKSQRWNMLFFLWGLFRARRVNCLDHVPGSSKKLDVPSLNVVTLGRYIPSPVMSLSENLCSPRRIIEESSACDRSCNAVLESNTPASLKLPILSSPATTNGDCDTKLYSLDRMLSGLQAKSDQQDSRLDPDSLSRIPTIGAKLCPELRYTSTSPKEHHDPDCKLDVERRFSVQATQSHSCSNKGEMMPMHWDIPNDGKDASSRSFKLLSVGPQEVGSVGSVGEEKILDRMNSSRDQVKLERNSKEVEGLDTEAALERETLMGDRSRKELNGLQFNHRKRSHLDLTQPASQASSSGTSQTMPWNDMSSLLVDGESFSKKLKTGFSGVYGSNSSRNTNALCDDFVSRVHDLGPSPTSMEKKCDGVCDEMDISEDSGATERFFFPVESLSVEDSRLANNSIPWKVLSSEDEVRLHDEVPNLELALGAETKLPKQGILPSPKQGILPFFVGMVDKKNNQDKPPVKVPTKEDDDDVSASLSLSLSFPFPDGERTVKPASKTEQLLPERRHANTSLILFGDFSDK
ncbi:hypothetical protein L1049_002011 [Liquidambar formosana]|uniref:Zinc finger PHD-type domain-containing protein n=1 Tax=Liquidambar formosana TaxID=63359 RepID=A0AAP0R8L7_LIQFO